MKPLDFFEKYYPFAKQSEEATGIPALVTLAQAAVESGWGERMSGQNNIFGIKDFDGVNGNEELILTFEFSKRDNLTPAQIGLQKILSINPSKDYPGYFRYSGYSYFRKYDTITDAFSDHAQIFYRVGAYQDALAYKSDPILFAKMISPVYAQNPNYFLMLKSIILTFQNYLNQTQNV